MQLSALYREMGGDGADFYQFLNKQAGKKVTKEAIKQLIPELHDVADPGKRPDKVIFVPSGEIDPVTKKPIMVMDTAPVTRAPLAIQKYIISQKGSFARGNGVILKPTDSDSIIAARVQNNWAKNKTNFDLKQIADRQMGETQCAVIFYSIKGAETLDQFNFKYKIVSPLKGDTLYPFFDEDTDDLIAFGREYKRGRKTRYDLYVINESTGLVEIRRYENKKPLQVDLLGEDGIPTGSEDLIIKTPYTKLPVVYWEQDEGECNDTDAIMSELESGFSDFLTGLGYTADPILFAKGQVMDLPAKGTQGKFIESTDPSADLKYITPDNATEARDLQFKMLIKFVFSLNRAVLLDLETMKDLGAMSGAALERYLIDAYMEATDRQQGSWGKGIQRMVNWMVSQWELLEGISDQGFRIDVVFTKYSLQDELEKVTLATTANGNKPVVDMKTGIEIAGLVDDADATLKLIEGETDVPVVAPAVV